ncbi:hypothetical protein BSL82_03850 [Tardibacter chloracetimidivorans]|uniref:Uncharacterized protein n=1 Tax=Tardibacter chloracetimidivorans TaxID=1921510 RepID=A0A1L3ZSE2_9SPHN|nr:hypothetical protein [Tardibacter chloracetimidivorans]API58551.1 hypothetical protein BSL82_03850 [Tardibacter chloracetimidivorans]
MLPWLRRFAGAIKHLLTTKDGETYAPSRVYWCLAALQFLCLSAWSVVGQGQAFNHTDFGTGMGLILTAGGIGVWITRKSEPDED